MRRTHLLLEFFSLLNARGIRHCVMGDSRALPRSVASDVDIVVPGAAIARLPMLMHEYCARIGSRLVQCLQHEHNAFYFVISFRDDAGSLAFLALDLCGDFCRRGRFYLSADEILASAVDALDADGARKGFATCAPAVEFCYYLVKKIDKERLEVGHGMYLSDLWQIDPSGCAMMIERFWRRGSIEARLLARAAESRDWSAVTRLLPRMRAALHRRSPLGVVALARELARLWRRWRQPTGLLVAMLGPDGSGKSTVVAKVDRQVRQAFRDTLIVHLRPGFLYRPERIGATAPHANAPHGTVRSVLKLVYFVSDYLLGYLFFLRPRIARSHGLLFDRYYDDLLADPARYRYRGSLRLPKILRALAPRPGLWLLLDAPTSVLQSRKQEVPWPETERQRNAYRKLLDDQAHVVVLDAERPVETVVDSAAEAVLSRCEERTRERLRLPHNQRRSPLAARWLLLCCRHRIPLLSKLTRLIFNSDIYCRTPRDLYLPHPYGIVIHSQTQLGRGVTVMQQVTLGGKDIDRNLAPVIGDNVYIGAGARVLGNVAVGAGAVIGANAVVTRPVPAGARVVGANRILRSAFDLAAVSQHRASRADDPNADDGDSRPRLASAIGVTHR